MYASVAYEMRVDNSKRFQACTIGQYGTTSDKTIVKFDGFVNDVLYGELYTNAEFKLQTAERKWVKEKGLYILMDGGYHKWRVMQCPMKQTNEEDETRWSEFAESIRKDGECSFGILLKCISSYKVQLHGIVKVILTMLYFHVSFYIICYMNSMDFKDGRQKLLMKKF